MHHLSIQWYDYVSIIGVIIVLITYFLLQTGKLQSNDYSYSGFNIVGSVLILYSLSYDWNLSAVVIEAFWILISLVGMIRQYTQRAAARKIIASDEKSK